MTVVVVIKFLECFIEAPDQGSRFKIQGSRFKDRDSRVKIQGSRFKIQDSRFKGQDSRIKIQDSRVKIQGSRLIKFLEAIIEAPHLLCRKPVEDLLGVGAIESYVTTNQ